MFGYVRPLTSELRLREYECYRAYYCGLCRAMGSCTGQCSRATLSYDIVFLAAVRCALTGERPEVKKIRCLVHPTKRRKAVINSPQLSYCADASAILSYRKCMDDRNDEKGFRNLRAIFAGAFLSAAYRKARRRHPELDRSVTAQLERLREFETSGTAPSADIPAAIFGDLMKEIFADGLTGTSARLAAQIGQTIGRWIYLADAADDFEQDRKRHRFNPYLRTFGDTFTPHDRETVRTALNAVLCETEQAFLLMDFSACPELKEIIANILYLGLPHTAARITSPPAEDGRSSSNGNEKGDQP